MTITLSLPTEVRATPQLMDFGVMLDPPLGGPSQRVGRLGNRWAVEFSEMDTLTGDCARTLLAQLVKARTQGERVITSWPQEAYDVSIGTPLVNGGSQAGSSLIVDGLRAGCTIPAGLFFSVTVSGRSYLYLLTDAVTANGSGQATLSIGPLLRASPADNAPLNFSNPQVEGFPAGDNLQWVLESRRYYDFELTIQEAR